MKVLIVGGGGREHALAWKAAQSNKVDKVYVAPGNAGTAREDKVRNVAVSPDDIDGLAALAKAENVGLTIVGPEAPLVAGIVDRFGEAGLRCFGPTASAARLEGSKAFTKDFLQRHHIPTGAYEVTLFSDTLEAVQDALQTGAQVVVTVEDTTPPGPIDPLSPMNGATEGPEPMAIASHDISLPLYAACMYFRH